jgi:hypothetical protein
MHVATCFDPKESSTGYYMNHNTDIYQMVIRIWDPKSLHKSLLDLNFFWDPKCALPVDIYICML